MEYCFREYSFEDSPLNCTRKTKSNASTFFNFRVVGAISSRAGAMVTRSTVSKSYSMVSDVLGLCRFKYFGLFIGGCSFFKKICLIIAYSANYCKRKRGGYVCSSSLKSFSLPATNSKAPSFNSQKRWFPIFYFSQFLFFFLKNLLILTKLCHILIVI